LPHYDGSGHSVAQTVQIGDTATDVGSEFDRTDVTNADRNPCLRGAQHDTFEVVERLRVAPAPNHVLCSAQFHEPPADIVVTAPHGFHYTVYGDAVRTKLIWIDVHLILADEAAQRRYFGHAGYGLELIA